MAKKLLTTPRGVFVWPRVTGTPDTKFNPEGKWKVTLRLSAEAGAPLVQSIDEAILASVATTKATFAKDPKTAKKKVKQADAPYKTDDETGEIEVTFKMTATGVSKPTKDAPEGKPWSRKPRIYNAKGIDVTNQDLKIGGGTEGKVSFELAPFHTDLVGSGVSLRLEAVQVLKLVEFGGGSAEQYGFSAEEDDEETTEETTETEGFTDETSATDDASTGADF